MVDTVQEDIRISGAAGCARKQCARPRIRGRRTTGELLGGRAAERGCCNGMHFLSRAATHCCSALNTQQKHPRARGTRSVFPRPAPTNIAQGRARAPYRGMSIHTSAQRLHFCLISTIEWPEMNGWAGSARAGREALKREGPGAALRCNEAQGSRHCV